MYFNSYIDLAWLDFWLDCCMRVTYEKLLVHRVTRPLRGSVSCGSGWSVPCVSIQLTLSQTFELFDSTTHLVCSESAQQLFPLA